MPVTMRDVARRANVSIKTVSRVVNNQGEISEATRQRVLDAISELGYRPSRIARAMVTQRTHTIGFVIPDITNPFFPEVARGIQDLAQSKDYNVFLCNTAENPYEDLQILQSLADHGVDGIILFSPSISDDDLETFADCFRPIVLFNRMFKHPCVSMVMADNYRGAQLAVAHLIDQGHTAIGMLAGASSSPDDVRRVKGYYDALAARGLTTNADWVKAGSPTLANGREAARDLLTQNPQLTAIFAYNDLLALGAVRACSDLGRRIPDDCAIVGFDDIRFASMATPSLTSVYYDKYELGQQATARLLDMVNEPRMAYPPIEIEVELKIRESTSKPD